MSYRSSNHHNAEEFNALKIHLNVFSATDSTQPVNPPIPVPVLRLALHGALMPGLAHEINNRLTAVVGYSQFARRRSDESTTADEIASIEKESLRAASNTRDILDVCRMKDEAIAAFDLDRLLSNIERLTCGTLRKMDVSLQIEKNHEFRFIQSCYRNALDGIIALLMGYAHVLPRRSVIQIHTLQDRSDVVIALNVEWIAHETVKSGAGSADSQASREEWESSWLFSLASRLLQRANLRVRYDANSMRLYLHAPGSQTEWSDSIVRVAEQPPRALIALEPDDQMSSPAISSRGKAAVAECCDIKSLVKYLEEDGFQVYVVEDPNSALHVVCGEDYSLLFFNMGRDSSILENVYHRLMEERPAMAEKVIFTACQSRCEDCRKLAGNLGRPLLTLPCEQSAVQQLVREAR